MNELADAAKLFVQFKIAELVIGVIGFAVLAVLAFKEWNEKKWI